MEEAELGMQSGAIFREVKQLAHLHDLLESVLERQNGSLWPLVWKATVSGRFPGLVNFSVLDLPGIDDQDIFLQRRAFAEIDLCDSLYLVLDKDNLGKQEVVRDLYLRNSSLTGRVWAGQVGIITKITPDLIEEKQKMLTAQKTFSSEFRTTTTRYAC